MIRRSLSFLIIVNGLLGGLLWSGSEEVVLQPVVSGLSRPLFLTHAGDGSGRLFIVEQGGRIRIVENGVLLPTPFLDISTGFNLISSGEQGLLGLAFHPDYSSNGLFYINYTRRLGLVTETVIQQHQVSGNPNVANQGGAQILTFVQDFSNHNGGWIGFSPIDEFLYIATGDGGLGGDPNDRAQALNTLLGKILRIDVDGGSPYAVPDSNPFVDMEGMDEIWAYGLRNPWRCSFDAADGRLFAGDVGQSTWEEIDIIVRKGNYGWDLVEGPECFPPPNAVCDMTGLEPPIDSLPRSLARAITGGYVYRGPSIPSLEGDYVFADSATGRIWALRESSGNWQRRQLMDTGLGIVSFGEDGDRHLYAIDHGGSVFLLTTPAPESGDVAISKTVSESTFILGDPVFFHIQVENLGPGEVQNVIVTDDLPGRVQLVGAQTSAGTCQVGNDSVQCELGTLQASDVVQITVEGIAQQVGFFQNTAGVTSNPPDSNSANNSSSDGAQIIALSDLAIQKTVSSLQIGLGQEFQYTLRVTNAGPNPATDVVVTDSLPQGLTFVSAPGCSLTGGDLVICSIGSMAVDAVAEVTLTVKATQLEIIQNTATVQGDETDIEDDNNSSSVNVSVVGIPDLEVVKRDLGVFVVGSVGRYEIQITNVGQAPTEGDILLTDNLPGGVGLLSVDAPGGTCGSVGQTVECTFAQVLQASQSLSVRVEVLLGPAAVPEVANTALVSTTGDFLTQNNSTTVSTPVLEADLLPRTFAQMALGGIFKVVVGVSNKLATPWEGRFLLRQGNEMEWGSSWSSNGVDQGSSSEIDVLLPGLGSQQFVLEGAEDVRQGYLRVVAEPGFAAGDIAVSFFYQNLNPDLVDVIGTFDTPPSKEFVFPVERSESTDTGLAYAPFQTTEPFQVRLILYDGLGLEVGSREWEFDGHRALLISDSFDSLPEDFVGSAHLYSEADLFLTVIRIETGGEGGVQLTNVPPETTR